MRAGEQSRSRLAAAFALVLTFTVVEGVAAFATGSLALLSDAGHMLTDTLALGMSMAAIGLATRGSSRQHRTFGWYRLEIFAALANAVLLIGVAAYVIYEAVRRFDDAPEVDAGPMLVVAVLGLLANLGGFLLLREGSKESLTVESAYLDNLADTVGSIGVVAAAVVIQFTDANWVDPVVAVAIGLWILPRTWSIAARAMRVLVEAAPHGMDMAAIESQLRGLDGVVDVHDLHVWTLTSQMDMATAHIVVAAGTDTHAVLDQARLLLREHRIEHATVQIEPDSHEGCEEIDW